METYGFKAPTEYPVKQDYNYVSEFSKLTKIAEKDLSRLVKGVGFWYDGRFLKKSYEKTRSAMYPCYECKFCEFQLSFKLWNPDEGTGIKEAYKQTPRYFVFVREKSNPYHDCLRELCDELPDCKKKELMEECPYLYNVVENGKKENQYNLSNKLQQSC